MAILGIVSPEALPTPTAPDPYYREVNCRRKIFYSYPTGKAPMMGILSRMASEATNQEEFTWFEQRYKEKVTTTISQGSSKGPFRLAANAVDGLDPFVLTSTGAQPTPQTEICVYVASTELFRVNNVIVINKIATGGGAATTESLKGIVTSVISSTVLKIRPISVPSTLAANPGYDNGATNENVGLEVRVIGTANPAGGYNNSNTTIQLPINPGNYCQFVRTPFAMAGRAMVTPVRFDDTGLYKSTAKQASIDHMVDLEQTFLFGDKSKSYTAASPIVPTTGAGLATYTTGGIEWFMKQWELGTVYGNSSSAITADTDDQKRIIENTAGTITLDQWNTYLERLFRGSNAVTNEVIGFCGTWFLKVANDMFKDSGQWNYMAPSGDTFGLAIVAYRCSFGTVYFTTHPLFSLNTELRKQCLMFNPNNLLYRYYNQRDTQLTKGMKDTNSLDGRVDEWQTDCGLEVHFPEAFMWLKNVNSFVP